MLKVIMLFLCFLTWAVPVGAASSGVPDADARLSQKITYESGYKRLHSVLEDLTKMTGVTVRCGRNSNDWWVRDLPVFVSVKDMQLGKLLRLLADSNRLILSCTKSSTTWGYRIWRDRNREKLLGECFQAEKSAAEAEQGWQWDRLSRLADVPESAIDLSGADSDTVTRVSRAFCFAQIAARLGPEGKKKVMDGGAVEVRPADLPEPLRSRLIEQAQSYWTESQEDLRRLAKDNPSQGWDRVLTPQDMERGAFISFRSIPGDALELTALIGLSLPDSSLSISLGGGIGYYAQVADMAKGYEFPERPVVQTPDEVASAAAPVEKEFRLLKTEDDWDTPFLRKKLKLEAPKDKKEIICSEFLAALSKAADCSIVCEDFYTHNVLLNYIDVYGSERTLAELLKQVKGQTWMVDEDAGLLIGWPSDWYRSQTRLVPESFLERLRTKLDSSGVDLDDFTPAAYFSWDQRWAWVVRNRYLEPVWWGTFDEADREVWQLYDALSPVDKARAKSPDGLPVSELDTNWLSAIFREYNRKTAGYHTHESPDERASWQIPDDPEVLRGMVMRVVKQIPETIYAQSPSDRTKFLQLQQAPKGFNKHVYHMQITGEVNGEKRLFAIDGPMFIYFPAYSERREREMLQEQRKAGPKTEERQMESGGPPTEAAK